MIISNLTTDIQFQVVLLVFITIENIYRINVSRKFVL